MNCTACDHFRADIDIGNTRRDRFCLERNAGPAVIAHFAQDCADGCPSFAWKGTSAIEPAVTRHLDRLARAQQWSEADMADAMRVAAMYPNAADWRPEMEQRKGGAA